MPRSRTQPHRFSASDAIATLQEALRNVTDRHTTGAPQVAVELTRNAKWDVQVSVKVTANTEATPAQLKKHAREVLAVAIETYDAAAKKYAAPGPVFGPSPSARADRRRAT